MTMFTPSPFPVDPDEPLFDYEDLDDIDLDEITEQDIQEENARARTDLKRVEGPEGPLRGTKRRRENMRRVMDPKLDEAGEPLEVPLQRTCNGHPVGFMSGHVPATGENLRMATWCGSETCPTCGKEDSRSHQRRAGRLLEQIGGCVEGGTTIHLTLTLTREMWAATDPIHMGPELSDELVGGVLRAAHRLVGRFWPNKDGWVNRGRLHWTGGDARKPKKGGEDWKPHIHYLIGHDEERETYLERVAFEAFRLALLKSWNRALSRVFAYHAERTDDPWRRQYLEDAASSSVKNAHYQPVTGASWDREKLCYVTPSDPDERQDIRRKQWLHRIRYEVGPRWLRGWWAHPDTDPKIRELYASVQYGKLISRWNQNRSALAFPTPQDDEPGKALERRALMSIGAGVSPVTGHRIVWVPGVMGGVEGQRLWKETEKLCEDFTPENGGRWDWLIEGCLAWSPPTKEYEPATRPTAQRE